MQVPPEESNRYFEFLTTQVKALKCLEFDPATILWHYTTGAGLIGILESGTIWATHVACVNDSSEIRYASRLFKRALQDSAHISDDVRLNEFVTQYLSILEEQPDIPSSARLPYFVACFTDLEDDLSQWCKYSGGENGYAIGMRAIDMLGIPNALLARVNYDAEQHLEAARMVAEATPKFFNEGLEKYGSTSEEDWAEAFLKTWDEAITQIAPLAKDPGFSAEREYRIIRQLQVGEVQNVKIIQKSTMMSRHLPLRFPRGNETRHPRLPIVKVLVGPSRHREVTRISVDTLLRQLGYSSGLVSSSGRPFQAT